MKRSMDIITKIEFDELVGQLKVRKKQREQLRYQPEPISHWDERDFLAVFDRTGSAGVLVYNKSMYPFIFAKRKANSTGRIEAIICDICATWRRGTGSGVLTFRKSATHSVSYLVCADLDCSLHVRGLTEASKISRTQLRENMDNEGRVARLQRRLQVILRELA